jgi:DNA-binding MarR family transcriptional regulator
MASPSAARELSSPAAAHTDGRDSAPPRWLNADERTAWLATAGIMLVLPAALDHRLQREAGVTWYEYMVLSVLSEAADRTMRMSEIATVTSSSLSRLSHVATRLEKRGLLTKERVPGSGRPTNATLTDAGYVLVAAAAPDHVAAVREYLIDGLEPADLATLRRVGTVVSDRITASLPCPEVNDTNDTGTPPQAGLSTR